MGIYDRDYYRTPSSRAGFSPFAFMSVTTWLIVANFAVAMIDSVLWHVFHIYHDLKLPWMVIRFPPLGYWGHFSVGTAIFDFQLWRFLTFQFLHAGLPHLIFNMLMLFFFGPLVESYLGRRRFLAFYLLCGIAGPFGYMLLWAVSSPNTMNLIQTSWVPLVGASAGLFGILVAAAQIAPDETVLVWGILPMKLRVMAWVALAFAVYVVFTGGHNAGGEAAHLGGAVLGWLLIRNPHWLNLFERGRRRTFAR